MLLIRNIMHCQPGKVRPMVEKFQAMNRIVQKNGLPAMRVLTDYCAERYWTVVSEMTVADMDEYEHRFSMESMSADDQEEFGRIMTGYHDLVVSGRREIFRIED